jgi:hypothetical protein
MRIIIAPILLVLIFTNCNKSGIPIGRAGYYFICKVDGVKFSPKNEKGFFGSSALDAKISENGTELELSAYDFATNESINIYLMDTSGIKTGDYRLSNFVLDRTSALYSGAPNAVTLSAFYTGAEKTGSLIINKINNKKRVVEGCFDFEALNSNTGASVSITDGSFSINF